MSWDAIQAQAAISPIGPHDEVGPMVLPPHAQAAQAAPGGGFGQLVTDGIANLNGQLVDSQVQLQRLATGDVQNLHQVMMNLEETRIAFQLFMQVRNRLLEAYQDVMKMQV